MATSINHPSVHEPASPELQQTLQKAFSHYQEGNLADAAEMDQRALEVSPEHPGALHLMGVIAQQQGRSRDAAEWMERAVLVSPDNPEIHTHLGIAYQSLNRIEEAERCFDKALSLDETYALARINRGNLLREEGKLLAAETCYRTALKYEPELIEALNNLGNLLKERGKSAEGVIYCRQAYNLAPHVPLIQWNLSLLLLLQNNYREGLPLYEGRIECGMRGFTGATAVCISLKPYPRWQGEPADGKRLLIWTEQGQGDSLMAMRYLSRLKARGAGYVMVYCEPSLERVMQAVEGVDQVIQTCQPLPFGSFDLHCPMMSLPFLFDTQVDSIPGRFPYFSIAPALRRKWHKRLSGFNRLKVGLVWGGGKVLRDDAKRSIPLALFAPLLLVDGVQLISLQKGEDSRQLAALKWQIPDWMDECGDFMDTAALVENLDLIISIDTAVAHLAGALGKPVWLLNRYQSDWRWGIEGEDSPWYPSMRIFRQSIPNDWELVIGQVATQLRGLLESHQVRSETRYERGSRASSTTRIVTKLARFFGGAAPSVSPPPAPSSNPVLANEMIQAGNLLEDQGQYAEALEQYRSALQHAPDSPRAHLNIGNAFLALDRTSEASRSYREAIRLDPTYAHAYFNLGNALKKLGQPDEAIAAYQTALRCDPNLADAAVSMGCIYEDEGLPDQAIEQYRTALLINPQLAGACFNLGRLLIIKREFDSAEKALKQATTIDPEYAEAFWQLSRAYTALGFGDKAIASIYRSRELQPNHAPYHSIALFDLNYLPDVSNEELFREHADYGEKISSGLVLPLAYANKREPNRRLRIGYVSGDFREHPVVRFIEPLLERHDRKQVEVYCYNTQDKSDAMTRKLMGAADQWRETAKLNDDATAELIRDDRIDILIDLSGHTGFQRLPVFARKPAPIQATWLGYLGTTGLKTMDYRICDAYTDPPGLTEKFHTEKLARLPDCQWCYRPHGVRPDPRPLPMLDNGYLTLGSFNNINKLNDKVLELWGRLLASIPESHLLIAAMPDSATARERILSIFARHGISESRLDFRPRQATLEYLRTCQEADIALDPFPYNGGTTSIDVLNMGVPIITLAGSRSVARGGVTLLSNLGMTQFIANSELEYIDIAVAWNKQPDRLASIRQSLPAMLAASALCDEARFVYNMEQLYRNMWKDWITGQGAASPRHD